MTEEVARLERFMSKLKKIKSTGCWEWQAGKRFNPWGLNYGQFYWGIVDGKEFNISSHRAAWEMLRGPIPAGMFILHKCHNPPCCNPDHLYVGDHDQNMRDRDESGRTSKWDKRYNFKRNEDLLTRVKAAFRSGLMAHQVKETLGIGWTTIYRCRDQDEELKMIMTETKKARYSKAAVQRWRDGKGKGSKSKDSS